MGYLETKGLSVGYDGQALIRDICLSIGKGEVVSLIGPNGAGKTTILKTIGSQLSPIAGAVYIDARDMAAIARRELSRQLAIVLTQRVNPELMTCRDVVSAGRYPYTGRLGVLSPEDERQVQEAMRTVRVEDLGERDFTAISDGQRQRVLLARALCQQPQIILLDEPTSFLDIRHKLELLGILRAMAKQKGITVVMSLHEIDLAHKVSDRIVCVKGETIHRFGTPDEVFSEPEIRRLYDVEQGFFDPCFGSVELARPEGEPEAFVISTCGSGIPIYRALQKQGTAFAAGILYTNDIDYRLARLLASEVVCERPFSEITEETYQHALRVMRICRRVIIADVEIGSCNRRMLDLIKEAENHTQCVHQ